MIQLGISAFYHDSAAALVIDGEVVAAIEEEKLSGIKHDNSFPLQAIQFCLDYAGLDISYVDVVCWYEEPELKYDRVSKTLGKRWIAKSKTWNEFKETFSKTEGNLKSYLENSIGYTGEIYYVKHHHSHLAFSYYTSPFKEALGVSIDGVGEWDTAVFAKCDEKGFTEIDNIKFPHSLGLVYSTITSYLGFKPNSGEYKVMGLAPYGDPKVYEYVFDKIERNSKHLFQVVKKYFTWEYSNTEMFTFELNKLIGFEPRLPEEGIEQHHMDLAASLQKWYEKRFYFILNRLASKTDSKNLVLGGGCAYNGTANGKIKKHAAINSVWIPYAPSDAGSSIGACLYHWHIVLRNPKVEGGDNRNPYLGPKYDKEYISEYVKENFKDDDWEFLPNKSLIKRVSQLINEGNIIGWFQDRTEFGARALGNRSILANPHISDIRDRINKVVKKREMFRPFAPSVTIEDYEKYFISEEEVPYMNQVVKVTDYKPIPSVTHIDGSARIQTVRREQNPLYYDLLKGFEKVSGTPILLNTSFNLRGKTMANSPYDAIWTFINSDMDYLVMGNYLISK